jgi:hypothetical protein
MHNCPIFSWLLHKADWTQKGQQRTQLLLDRYEESGRAWGEHAFCGCS